MDYSLLFKLLDTYSTNRHHCSLTELFLNEEKTEYIMCFRPNAVSRESLARYTCRYIRVKAEEITTKETMQSLPISVKNKLDKELPLLQRSLSSN